MLHFLSIIGFIVSQNLRHYIFRLFAFCAFLTSRLKIVWV